jgi:hypothetical protein
MTANRSPWLARARNLASSAYHRTVGEVVQRRRSRAYMAAGGAAARPGPVADRDLALTRAPARRERPQDRPAPHRVRAPRTGRTPR